MTQQSPLAVAPPLQPAATTAGAAATQAGLRTGSRLVLGLSIVLAAFNLRTVFSSLSALLPEIVRATGMSSSTVSSLTILPVVCLGLFAPLATRLSDRFGVDRVLLGGLVLQAVAIGLRGLGTVPILFLAALLAGAGIAIGNVLLPVLVKRDFPDRIALMTGLYTMGLCGGAAIAAAATFPLAESLDGNWSLALGLWCLPAALAALVWSTQARPGGPRVGGPRTPHGLWRSGLAWQVTGVMGLQSALAYTVFGWLAPILRERGMDGVSAGIVVSVLMLAQVAGCLVTPAMAVRARDQRLLNVLLTVAAIGALYGLLFAPLGGVWLYAIISGYAQGGLLAVALTMVALRSANAKVAAHLSGMMQSGGYLIAAVAPWLIGVLHDATGSFDAVGWLLAAIGVGLALCGLGAGRPLQIGAGEVQP